MTTKKRTITSFISPYEVDRRRARKVIGDSYIEVHVSTPLEECEKRDVKGLYQKARSGVIKHFTGIDDPFEKPQEGESDLNFSCNSPGSINAYVDEIIDFSGVERYINTPVKRYSSGMYVRLAFAVAANLESEILIVDEVLAVGDAEFQKKAIGKMQSISNQGGRTVLFVSHNMTSIKALCNRAVLLENGKIQTVDKEKLVCLKHY